MRRLAGARVERWRFGADAAPLAAALGRGGMLAIPTESSYGLAVDPSDPRAVERLFELKGRPRERAFPVVAADLAQLAALGVDLEDPGVAWAAARWPAALTVVAPLARPLAAAAEGGSLAVRIPGLEPLRGLLRALGRGLTATSANPTGEEPYLDAEGVAAWLERAGVEAWVVDGGRLPGGAPSTLVAWRAGSLHVLRQGSYRIA